MYWWNKHTEPTIHFMAQCIYCNNLLKVSVHSCEYRASPFLGHSSHWGPQALMESSSIQQHMDLEICMARALEQRPCLYSRKQLPRLVSVRNSINTTIRILPSWNGYKPYHHSGEHLWSVHIPDFNNVYKYTVLDLRFCTYPDKFFRPFVTGSQ